MDAVIIITVKIFGLIALVLLLVVCISSLVQLVINIIAKSVWAKNKWLLMNFHHMSEVGEGTVTKRRLKSCMEGERMSSQLILIRDTVNEVLNERKDISK